MAGVVVLVLWAGAWLLLSGALSSGVGWTQNQLYEMAGQAGFSVQDVLVEGRINSDPDILRALVNVERGDPLFSFDPKEARELIERISWVKEAHIERRLPGTVYIGLLEREPMALWQNKGKIRLIDTEGVTLTDRKLKKFADLVIVVGERAPQHAPDFLAMISAEPALEKRIEAATWVGDRRWDLKLKNGAVVKLPENDPGLALRRLALVQESDALLDKDLKVIDVREPDRLTVRTRPGAVQEYKEGLKGNDI